MRLRYGTGELYGYDFSALPPQRIRELSLVSHRDIECPFRPVEPGKPIPKCNKKGGVCSLRQFVLSNAGIVEAHGEPVTTCPNRFLESNLVVRWVGETLLGTSNPVVISELPFLMGEADAEDDDQDAVGKIDKVLVNAEGNMLRWCALEIQAVYFSGKSMENDFKVMREWNGPGLPFPQVQRRPDFRSSGPKRLMPQLQIKVPTISRWGKKMAVVVDKAFWDSLSDMREVKDLSNSEIVWFVDAFSDPTDDRFSLLRHEIDGTTLGPHVQPSHVTEGKRLLAEISAVPATLLRILFASTRSPSLKQSACSTIMRRRPKAPETLSDCQGQIEFMLKLSKTRVIAPILTFSLLRAFEKQGQTLFDEREVRGVYVAGVRYMREFLKHDLHIGAKYEDAYHSRTLPKYHVLAKRDNRYELQAPYTTCCGPLLAWIPQRIRSYIDDKLDLIPNLQSHAFRAEIAAAADRFLEVVRTHIEKNAANFEIICFAVLRVHLEKFACRIYRDTRAAAHDKGVDISTNFGVVYQIKKLQVFDQETCDTIVSELQANFDTQRLADGNVIVVIDDIRKEFKQYLITKKIQAISKAQLLKFAAQFEDLEDREKVLRIVHDEFRQEYASVIT